jgi:hypothetical protein
MRQILDPGRPRVDELANLSIPSIVERTFNFTGV